MVVSSGWLLVVPVSRTICFPSDIPIYGISHDGSKNFNTRTCEHTIFGQLMMGARQKKNAPVHQITLCPISLCDCQSPSSLTPSLTFRAVNGQMKKLQIV